MAQGERHAGLDALRCLCMLMVVLLHVLLHGGALREADSAAMDARTAVLWILEMGAVCAVNGFGMLSGYWGVKRRMRAASFLKLWLQVVVYAVGIDFAWALLRQDPARAAGWTKGLAPVTGGMYWYFSAYAGLCLLMPALNHLLQSAGGARLRRWLMLLMTAVFAEQIAVDSDVLLLSGGCSTLWLAVLYCLGGTIRLHGDASRGYRRLRKAGLPAYAVLSVAAGLYWWARMSGRYPLLGGTARWSQITAYTSPFAVLSAVCLFAAFEGWQPGQRTRRAIGFAAPAAFAVYLIHTHPVFWNEILLNRTAGLSQEPMLRMLASIAAAVLAIFAACVIVERIRMKVFALLGLNAACDRLGSLAERAADSLLGDDSGR